MQETDTIKGKKLEAVDNKLFGSFNAEDESWIGGSNTTLTSRLTYSSGAIDAAADFDLNFEELEA